MADPKHMRVGKHRVAKSAFIAALCGDRVVFSPNRQELWDSTTTGASANISRLPDAAGFIYCKCACGFREFWDPQHKQNSS